MGVEMQEEGVDVVDAEGKRRRSRFDSSEARQSFLRRGETPKEEGPATYEAVEGS